MPDEFLKQKIKEVIASYPNANEYVWAQEEPKNMGAWTYILERLDFIKLSVASRKYYSVPAAGSSARFKRRQRAVIDMVFNSDKQ